MLNQEGSLLDSEGGVGSLGADWSINVPVGISSHLGATAELAEIFGTSDDEDESFNFNLNTGLSLAKDLGLDEEAKKFDSSPILNVAESQLFLNSMQDAISIDPKDTVSDGAAGKGAEGVKIELGEELLDSPSPQTGERNSVTSLGESREDGDDAPKRKSVRIRKRMEDVAAKVQDFSRDRKLARAEFGEGGLTAYSSARTSGGGKLDEADTEGKEMQTTSCKEEEEEEGSAGSDEGEESDDPDKLWCICRQPHGDRFMICCDCCGEWYHGDCIGISVSQGKRMERAGEDYVCVSCQERERLRKEQREADRKMRLAKREQAKEKDASVKSEDNASSPGHAHHAGSSPTHAHHTSGSTSGEDQYGAGELFKPDNAPKEAGPALGGGGQEALSRLAGSTPPQVQPKEGVEAKLASSSTEQKLRVKETSSASCIGPDCGKVATPPSVYCSDRCVERHAAKMLRVLAKRGVIVQTTPGEFVRGGGGVSVLERATGKMVMGLSAPSEKKLVGWLKMHPSYQVLLPHGKGVKTKGGVQKKEMSENTHKPAKPSLDEGSIRANAKKALFQTLWTRREGMSDLDVGEEKVAQIAALIEDKLYDVHKDITPKYKMKYRSLLFNLKDTKNQGLFRKVLLEEVSPELLVQMSPEELASEELTHWREQAMKKDLEMIKIREVEEAQNMAGTIRKMTYKGEVEIEVPEMAMTGAVDTIPPTQQTEVTPKVEPGTEGEGPMLDKPKSDSKDVKSQSKAAESKPSILDLLDNTTANHGSHVFDHRCDICMGKVTPPTLPPPPPPPPTSLQPPSPLTPPPVQTDTSSASTPDSSVPAASEDNVLDIPEPRSPDPNMEPIWHGSVSMHLLPKFNACAYQVSGMADGLSDVLPDALQVMGRIAYVQVWDYLEKLQKSTTRDITVLRLDWQEGDYDAYTEMLQYLVSKHRCGVVQSGFGGVKDFYLVPLMRTDEIPPQLLPLQGPGLSRQRSDMLLAVIVRSRSKPPPRSIREVRHAHSSHKRHHADGSTEGLRSKRVRFQVENGASISPSLLESNPVGSLGAAKARSSVESIPLVTMTTVIPEVTSGLTPTSPVVTPEATSLTPVGTVQMSFYGQALSPPAQTLPLQGGAAPPIVNPPVVLPPSNELVPIITSSAVSSILSQLTDEKIKELASAMSALSSTTALGQVPGPQAQMLPAVAVQDTLAAVPVDSSTATSVSSVPAPSELQSAPTDAVHPLHQQEQGRGKHDATNVNSPVLPTAVYSSVPPTAPYTTAVPSVSSGYPSDAPSTTGYPVAPSVAMDYQPQGGEGYAHQAAPYPQDPSYQYPVHPPAAPYAGPSAYHQGAPSSAYYGPDQGNYPYPPDAYPSQYPDPHYGYDPQGDPRGYHGDSEQGQGQYYHRDYSDASQSWSSGHRNYDDERRGDARDYAPKGREHAREWKQRSGRFRYEGGYDGSYDRR